MTSLSRLWHSWLRQRLLHVWQGLEQSLIDDTIDQWPTRLRALTVNLFSLYLMNFMFGITLDAVGNILRVHYKSWKCDVSFSQGK